MTAASQHAAERRKNTRKALSIRVAELESTLKAQNGETRKNMRERLARTTKELADLKTQSVPKKEHDEVVRARDALEKEVEELNKKLEALQPKP